ncbi:hypothetical protein [Bradyrhizobium neotropicale]|nr:hypothetical protein [Bradyrhizobium neotropicale]
MIAIDIMAPTNTRHRAAWSADQGFVEHGVDATIRRRKHPGISGLSSRLT